MKLFDPTSKPVERAMNWRRRPASPRGLRLGLVENTKFNANPILEKLAERLAPAPSDDGERPESQALGEP